MEFPEKYTELGAIAQETDHQEMKTQTQEDLPCPSQKIGEISSDHFGVGVKEKNQKMPRLRNVQVGERGYASWNEGGDSFE